MKADLARAALANRLLYAHHGVSAAALEAHPPEEVERLISAQPPAVAARVLEAMLPRSLASMLDRMRDSELTSIVPSVAPDRTAAALRWSGEERRSKIIATLPAGYAKQVREQMSYPADTAGALMDPRTVVVRRSDRVSDALDRLKSRPEEHLYEVFVVDDQQHLVGTIPIQLLATAAREDPIGPLVRPAEQTLDVFAPREDVADFLSETALPSIAVVDRQGRLAGVLRYRTLLGVAEHDAATALQRMVGADEDETALSPVMFAVRKRLPWLNINLLTAFLAALVVGLFESTIAQVTSLAVLLPVVAGQSGNSGSQALAVTMRSLALREITTRHWLRVAFKETLVGVINGLAIAIAAGLAVYIWSRTWALSAIIGVSMVIAMAAAGLSGASIPVLLKRFGQDPAQSSSIILTTVTDVVGFFVFLGLASSMMTYLL